MSVEPSPSFVMRGAAGQVLAGTRLVALFSEWEATSIPSPDRAMRVSAKRLELHPVWGRHPTGQWRAELEVGRFTIVGIVTDFSGDHGKPCSFVLREVRDE